MRAVPFGEGALAQCVAGLTPSEWLRMLNQRVYFWTTEAALDRLRQARMNRARVREILVFDTLALVRAHGSRVELSPINSGATLRKPARRDVSTFTSLGALSYADWRKQRGKRDLIKELVIRDGVRDISRYLVEVRKVGGG